MTQYSSAEESSKQYWQLGSSILEASEQLLRRVEREIGISTSVLYLEGKEPTFASMWIMKEVKPLIQYVPDLRYVLTGVGKAVLPIDADKYPHGDINDYVAKERATADDLYSLLQQNNRVGTGSLGNG